jgi:hypothetical protein
MSLMPPEYFFPLLGMTFALGWGVLATMRWYVKQRLRARQAEQREEPGIESERLAALEGRIAELEERVDFTERVLAQQREAGRLGRADG